MPRVVKRSARPAVKSGQSRRVQRKDARLPAFVPPQLSLPVEKLPSGPRWLHEIKLDGFRMAARIAHGRVQLLTRTGLDWTGKYPSAVAALAKVKAQTAYIDASARALQQASLRRRSNPPGPTSCDKRDDEGRDSSSGDAASSR